MFVRKNFLKCVFPSCNKLRGTLTKGHEDEKIRSVSLQSIQRKTLIRSTLQSLEDVLKHAVIRSGAPLKCLSEKSFRNVFSGRE